jgi:hypothetical protein
MQMSESGLSVGLAELRAEVGYFLGMGRGVAVAWTAAQETEIDNLVQSGVRRVYYPPALNANVVGYEWSWLRPTSTLAISVAGGYDYDLPDDFGRLVGSLYYPAEEYRNAISIVSVGRLLNMRAQSDESGAPVCSATRYKTSTGTTGQRQEIIFFPTPDASWTLNYEYEAYSGALTETYPYPLGGMQLAELYIESCLAISESRVNDEIGQHTQQFNLLLMDAITRDRKRGAQLYGPMGHAENRTEEWHRGWTGGTYPITYKGNPI